MAREEAPREDLLTEAVALSPRVELAIGAGPTCVIGLRPAGGGSCYFGDDPVYHFNRQGELRRAFLNGNLLVARDGRLISLSRRRTLQETTLVSSDLTSQQSAEVLAELQSRLNELRAALASGQAHPTRAAPDSPESLTAVRTWLDGLPQPIPIAKRPNA